MWQSLGHNESVHRVNWPKYDEAAMVKDTIEIVIQINGKVKEKMNIKNNLDKAALEAIAMENEKVKVLIDGKNIVKVIAVPNKLLNIVVK